VTVRKKKTRKLEKKKSAEGRGKKGSVKDKKKIHKKAKPPATTRNT